MVALAAVFVACKKTSPADELIKTFTDLTEKVTKAESIDAITALGAEAEKTMNGLAEKYPDFQPTADEEKAVNEAMAKFQEALEAATEKFAPAEAEPTEGEGEEVAPEEAAPEAEAEAPAEETAEEPAPEEAPAE